MSGLEILGFTAGVIQIADTGAKLSVKLFTFSQSVKNAPKNINTISQEVAVASTVLHRLELELKKDEQCKLSSKETISTMQALVAGCNAIFRNLDEVVGGRISDKKGFNYRIGGFEVTAEVHVHGVADCLSTDQT